MRKFYSKNASPNIRAVLKLAVLFALILVYFTACPQPTEPTEITLSDFPFDFGTEKLPGGMTLGCSGDGATNPVIKDGVMTVNVKSMFVGSTSYLTINVSADSNMELSYKVYMDTWGGNDEAPESGKFRVYIDDGKVKEYGGASQKWEDDVVAVPFGKHSIKFIYEKTSNIILKDENRNVVKLDDISFEKPITYSSISEDFEGSSLKEKYNWLGSATLTSASELKAGQNELYGVSGKFAMLSIKNYMETTELTIRNVVVSGKSVFSFKYLPSICEKIDFSVLFDGEKQPISYVYNWNNTQSWHSETLEISAGIHTITFRVANPEGWQSDALYNALFIDDLSLVPDVVSGVKVTPRAKQQTYIGCKDYEKIVAEGYAVRADGTIKSDIKVTFSATGGTIDANGVFTPTSVGKAKITASYGEFTAESGEITVFDADYMRKPFVYNGKTYQGTIVGTESGELITYNSPVGETTLTFPTCGTFEADGFFTIEGTVNNPKNYNYATVDVFKGEASKDSLWTRYVVHDSFCERIWLRFGKGEYTIIIYNINNVKFSEKLGEVGILNWEGGYGTKSFKVTNIRDESAGGESDGRWIYPSDIVRSDNFLITNTTDEILYDLPNNATDRQKMKAIHDYIVRTKYYDNASLENGMRKKQDAISVMRYGTGVCEGYANLTAAMSRYAGIPVKFVGGDNREPGEEGHAWNNVYIDGKWYFIDTTWDDDSNPDSDAVRHDYFLLETMDGLNGDHNVFDYSEDTSRFIIPVPTIYKWTEDYSNGWY